jgi:hypothetical protein
MRSPSDSLTIRAVIAGIIGGIIVDAFLSIRLHISPIDLEAHTAATAIGPGTSPVLGTVVHFAIAIGWALIYAFSANAAGRLANWIVGGIVLGIVVDAVMNFLIAIKTGAPWGSSFVDGLITNVVFYALPVAFYLARTVRRA